ncbi:COP9 signalosome complex subunit 1 [Tanacetum coccineum]
MGYNDLGDFYYAHGALKDAFENYVCTRDHCTTAKHFMHMYLNAILVSIEMGEFAHVTSYVSEAEQYKADLDAVTIAKLNCAAGLAHLEAKNYRLAAQKFLDTAPELGNNYSEVIAAQDVATGGLCALASFDRVELQAKVIDNNYLGNLKANLLLDIHLHDHVEMLYSQIRNNALIRYSHVDMLFESDLNKMAGAFKTTVAGLQKELETLNTQVFLGGHLSELYEKILVASPVKTLLRFRSVWQVMEAFDL